MSRLFWLYEAQFVRLRPLLPRKPRGMACVDDLQAQDMASDAYSSAAALAFTTGALGTSLP